MISKEWRRQGESNPCLPVDSRVPCHWAMAAWGGRPASNRQPPGSPGELPPAPRPPRISRRRPRISRQRPRSPGRHAEPRHQGPPGDRRTVVGYRPHRTRRVPPRLLLRYSVFKFVARRSIRLSHGSRRGVPESRNPRGLGATRGFSLGTFLGSQSSFTSGWRVGFG